MKLSLNAIAVELWLDDAAELEELEDKQEELEFLKAHQNEGNDIVEYLGDEMEILLWQINKAKERGDFEAANKKLLAYEKIRKEFNEIVSLIREG